MAVRTIIPTLLALLLGHGAQADSGEYQLIQPARGDSGVVLHSKPGSAELETREGIRKSLPVRKSERLTTLVETGSAWVSAGTRDRAWRRELVLVSIRGSRIDRLAAPGGQSNDFRLSPALLADDSGFEGIAWLEGPDLRSLGVRLAQIDEEGWSDPLEIPRATRGSQSGLSATLLDEGNWLLVWAAHDGSDDDLFYSLVIGERATRPRRVTSNNRVADIMPSLIAADGRAFLAWSQLEDGDYRIKTSRFDGSGWSSPKTHGPPGSIRAQLSLQDNQVRLLYRESWPRRWTVSELANSGRPERRARFEVVTNDQPIISQSAGSVVVLRWPGSKSDEASWETVP